ncbi:MAG: DUF3810 domain-containing protein [Clostridia bacterium]|nr:DUF3810 domain-containing protein [Clostridia bacterium]
MKRFKEFVNNYIPKYSIILFFIFLTSLLIYIIGSLSVPFAEWVTNYLGHPIRWLLASVSSLVPFSLGELCLMLSPFLLILLICIGIRKKGKGQLLRFTASVLSVVSLFYSGYVFTLGIGYRRTSIADRMSLEPVDITSESLTEALVILRDECEKLLPKVTYLESGSSDLTGDFDEMCESIIEGYSALGEEYPELGIKNFDSKAKPVIMSKLMSKLEILGIYSFFTGESNVNVHYPDYNLPFTVAHEFAHQRGISRENEANFAAFLVCIRSSDPYVRYSGYMNMFEYVASALGKTDKEALKTVYLDTDPRMIGEMRAYNEFYYANKSEFLSKLSEFVNDKYLKSQGTEGIISYGLVVRLCVAYYCNE